LWARNGKQLFYRQSGQVLVADVLGGSDFAVSKPRALFEIQGSYLSGTLARSWDISLDGRRFMMVKNEDRKSDPITEFIFVENWFEELKRLCPIGKN